MADSRETIRSLFDLQAENYSQQNSAGMLDHYAPEEDLMFWSSEGARINGHDALKLWYEALFQQFEILSVKYRIESAWEGQGQIACCSTWQLETRLRDVELAAVEPQFLRATHVLRQYQGEWKIVHIHSSPIGQASADFPTS
ncbi:nuclear transport factor 2 family protein [Endozoicomonas sp. 4G]|uniref:YybH family protein n=1 Tax=Endozoicomonas sp. 4G TaxID=2872754 RepID=UPI00207875D1|nr:nuclear transport factor 2 family protein [Endozoicomonas sp. 4G]